MPQLWGNERMFLNKIEGCDTVRAPQPSTGWMSGKVPRELTPPSILLPPGLSKMFFLALPSAPFPDIRSAGAGATVSAHACISTHAGLQALPTMKICTPC